MSHARRFDHVGITVADLDTVMAFFVGLGLEVEGRTFVEGEFLDTVSGSPTPAPRSSCCGRPTEVPG
jgi:catechol 2,3-dioxygenase-like lactoylglutathione lyase family enzyme